MDKINADLELLENLSKKISDLVYNNDFTQISEINAQRNLIITNIEKSENQKNEIRSRVKSLEENNAMIVETIENKLYLFSKNHNKFNKRLKAYFINK